MLGDSSVLATSGDAAAVALTRVPGEGGDGGGGVGVDEGEEDKNTVGVDEGDRLNYGSNRWPRQETLALLKIRSDMDQVFRDASLKGPLWEEVSRKLAELGHHRSAKKCKEKFENVYKYHKRTKEGRTGKSQGKTYRFFDQLEAFEIHQPHPPSSKPQIPMMAPWPNTPSLPDHVTVSSTTNHLNITSQKPTIPTPMYPSHNIFPSSIQNISEHIFSSSTSSSTASDEELEGSRKRKRKWKDFFQRLTKDVIKRQEELQRKFLETVEKLEYERIVREEAWRAQEMARISREHDILIQERSTTAAKDAAVIAILEKISGQQISVQKQDNIVPPQLQTKPPPPQSQPPPAHSIITKRDNRENFVVSISSRWPKSEVLDLINLRTSLDTMYNENGPKGPLWEEISAGMHKLGYNRSAKRCKEKWENINKYYKKMKDSSKNRTADSKTCPYFHQLEAIYKRKSINTETSVNSGYGEPLMVRPEQQWPVQQENQPETVMEDNERKNMDQTIELEEEEVDEEEEDGDTEDEEERGGFEVVANKRALLAMVSATR